MEKIIYGSKMKKVDSYTMEVIGIPSMVLMERAAFSVFMDIEKNIDKTKSFLCLCGMGNNGADGIALSRMLKIAGYDVSVITIGDESKATKQWLSQRDIALECEVVIEKVDDLLVTVDKAISYHNIEAKVKTYDYVVDAIFGIGLTREILGIYKDIIGIVNNERNRVGNDRLKVYALDVPSGLCADTGKIMGSAIYADKTYTFGAMKTGLLLYKGKDVAGKTVVCDIGFPNKAYEEGLDKRDICYMVTSDDIKNISHRKKNSNKGTYGKVVVIAGSKDMYGAAYFSARAALEMGAGLVRIITHANNRNLIYDRLPEAMISSYNTGEDEELLKKMVKEAISWCDSIVIGPGLSKGKEACILLEEAMKLSKEYKKHIVIDADGLNIISDNKKLTKYYHESTVITPHVGEASRLMDKKSMVTDIAGNIIDAAKMYGAKHNINVIQKESTTVILGIECCDDKCNNRVCINTSGNPGMATGGSGDVLAGMVAAVLAGSIDIDKQDFLEDMSLKEWKKSKTFLGASIATYIHGLAGDIAAKECGETSMMATDILDMIHIVMDNRYRQQLH